ncbi:head GIN domain-containing protein [Lutibacter sp.]|uniref:head GIN domain-containing protein n=1 Tax=Lutibacter sp. TaxID=1925666 RepID=UPI00356B187B
MKLFTSILAILIVIANLNAQMFTKKIKGNGTIITNTRTVSDYDKVAVAGSFDVKLLKGKEGILTVKADENLMEYIITEVKNGDLEIHIKKGFNISTNKTINITVPFETINAISLAGSGDITSEDIIDSSDLTLKLAGSGNMSLNVSTKNLTTSIAGSGNMSLKGDSNEFECNIAGSGNINGYELKALIANAKITGSGTIKINAVNEIHAKSAGSGNIYYSGNPSIEKISSVGSGSVKKKN